MTISVFYSWQSDLPNKTNRTFIETAISKAIDELKQDILMQEALRDEEILLDKDTQGVPGTPPITDTIFEKISECDVFIPDFSFVGRTDNDRLLPNPNVLIEYGWALKELTTSRIVPIMNSHFGNSNNNNLPFDMRHLRNPMTYNLSPACSAEDKKLCLKEVSGRIKDAISLIIEKAPEKVKKKLIHNPVPHMASPSIFTNINEIFGYSQDDKELHLPKTPKIFLRIIPSNPIKEDITSKKAIYMMKKGSLMTFSQSASGGNFGRNKHGAFIYDSFQDKEITHLTQLFKNGEIWGIDNRCLAGRRGVNEINPVKYVPCVYFEQAFVNTMTNYLKFAEVSLELNFPFIFIAGLTDIEDYKMTAPTNMGFDGGFSRFGGRAFGDNIIKQGEITNNTLTPAKILRPFFNYVWEEFGVERPDIEVCS